MRKENIILIISIIIFILVCTTVYFKARKLNNSHDEYILTTKQIKARNIALEQAIDSMQKAIEWELFYEALTIVESNQNSSKVGDDGLAVGIAQIQPVILADLLRLGSEFSSYDRFDALKSRQMYQLIQNHYNPERDLYTAAMVWNSGGGKKYYDKIMTEFNKLKLLNGIEFMKTRKVLKLYLDDSK